MYSLYLLFLERCIKIVSTICLWGGMRETGDVKWKEDLSVIIFCYHSTYFLKNNAQYFLSIAILGNQ